MKFTFVIYFFSLGLISIAQVNDNAVSKYLTGRDWVIISEKSNNELTNISYDDLMFLRFNKDNTGITNYVNESDEEDIIFNWEYSEGFLNLIDESGDVFDEELNGRIEMLDSTRMTLKLIDSEIRYIYCQERRNLKVMDIGLYEKAVELNTDIAYRTYIDKMPSGKYVEMVKNSLSGFEWEAARKSRDLNKIKAFSEEFEESDYYDDAQFLIDEINWETCQRLSNKSGYATYINEANRGYAQHLAEAYNKYEEFSWTDVVNANSTEAYSEYLRVYPTGKYSVLAKDHLKFAESQKENSIPAYNNYLSAFPSGLHASEVGEILANAYYYWGNKSYESFISLNGDGPLVSVTAGLSMYINEALSYYEKLINEFPMNAKAIEIKNKRYAETCYYKAEMLFLDGKYEEAIQYYNQYLAASPNGKFSSDANSKKGKAQKKLQKQNLPDLSYFQYNATINSPVGIAFGYANTGSIGLFVSFRMNPGVLHGNSYYTYDGNNFTGNVFDPRITGKEVRGNLSISTGASVILSYPFSIWMSFGYYYENVTMEVDEYDEYGEYYETKWILDKSRSLNGIDTGIGLMLNSRDISLCLGLSIINMSESSLNFGIGWTF